MSGSDHVTSFKVSGVKPVREKFTQRETKIENKGVEKMVSKGN